MDFRKIFGVPTLHSHRQYEALRAFYLEKVGAKEIAERFGYTVSAVYSLIRDFRNSCTDESSALLYFFQEKKRGPKSSGDGKTAVDTILSLRKKYLSVKDIKAIMDARQMGVTEGFIYTVLKKDGFERLPRRTKKERATALGNIKPIQAQASAVFEGDSDRFSSENLGVFCFWPYIMQHGIWEVIQSSPYPGTKAIPSTNSILSFLALKLCNVRRYTVDDLWCMDRGLGLFAGLNVLPKASWFSSYSHRITREMNLSFLKQLHSKWVEAGLLSDTANLDFVSIPCWGDDTHLENNWSGTRHQALASMLAVLANDPESGIITYGDTCIRHEREAEVVLEFLDFYRKDSPGSDVRYLVFDSKFTTYENLKRLDEAGVYFLTIRRRGKNVVQELEDLPSSEWKSVRVPCAGNKTRLLSVNDSRVYLRAYGKELRQIAIKGHGRIKPALIITNDLETSQIELIRKYAKRWLVEKTISEQTHFFHLNRLSSSMVIKVDFDLVMTILAHNLYRLFAMDLPGHEQCSASTIYERFVSNGGSVAINNSQVQVSLRKKRHHPVLLEAMSPLSDTKIPWLGGRALECIIGSSS